MGNSDSESPFTQCKLDKHYIDPNAAIVKDPEFESGVTKIQRGEVALMMEEDIKVCINYKWSNATRLQR